MKRTSFTPASANGLLVEPFLYPDQQETQSPWNDLEREEERIEQSSPELIPDTGLLVDEARKGAYTDGRELGIEEGRKLERAAHAEEAAESFARLEHALDAFVAAREQIVQDFEPAVVRLALAVAARILRREAHTDPLLLSGAVRVALGQLSATSEVRLRVPAAEETMWTEWAAMLPNVRSRLVVEAGEGMRLGDCMVETELGSADLGVRAQLGEIDRTFFESAGEVKGT
jgi:flagellar assembly protein FliH